MLIDLHRRLGGLRGSSHLNIIAIFDPAGRPVQSKLPQALDLEHIRSRHPFGHGPMRGLIPGFVIEKVAVVLDFYFRDLGDQHLSMVGFQKEDLVVFEADITSDVVQEAVLELLEGPGVGFDGGSRGGVVVLAGLVGGASEFVLRSRTSELKCVIVVPHHGGVVVGPLKGPALA